MFWEEEFNFKKNILFKLYIVLIILLSSLGIIYYLKIHNNITTKMFLLTIACLIISLILLKKNALEASSHLAIVSITLSILISQFLSPESWYNLVGLILPVLLAGLMEGKKFLIILVSIIILILTFHLIHQGSISFTFYIMLTAITVTTASILLFFNTYSHHLEESRVMLLNKTIDVAIFILAYTTELRDEDTGDHVERVSSTSLALAREIRKNRAYKHYITEAYLNDLQKASTLHDIGKVIIPDSILLKPARLTPDEFKIIKSHTVKGAEIIKVARERIDEQSVFTMAEQIAESHHERWDGTGYPLGLSGDAIPLSAQIVALADVYDALASQRCYKKKLPHKECVEIIKNERNRHFSPLITDSFLAIEKNIERHYKSGN